MAAVLAAAAAHAQEHRFNPQLATSWAYTNNVAYIDPKIYVDPEDAVDASDQYWVFGVSLPYTRSTPRGDSLSLSYNGAYSKYDEFTGLDSWDHSASLQSSVNVTRANNLNLGLYYSDTQIQGASLFTPSDLPSQLLSYRTRRESFGASIGFSAQPRRLWSYGIDGRFNRSLVDPIEGFEPPPGLFLEIENQDYYQLGMRVARDVAEKTSVGLDYRYMFIDYEISGEESYHRLGATWEREFTRFTTFGVLAGAYARDFEAEPDTVGVESKSEVGLALDFNLLYTRPIGNMQIGVDFGIRPGAGDVLRGSSIEAFVESSLSSGETYRAWSWTALARYTHREPFASDASRSDTFGVAGFAEYRPQGWLDGLFGLRAGANWQDQGVGATGGNTLVVREANYYTAYVAGVLYPLYRRYR